MNNGELPQLDLTTEDDPRTWPTGMLEFITVILAVAIYRCRERQLSRSTSSAIAELEATTSQMKNEIAQFDIVIYQRDTLFTGYESYRLENQRLRESLANQNSKEDRLVALGLKLAKQVKR